MGGHRDLPSEDEHREYPAPSGVVAPNQLAIEPIRKTLHVQVTSGAWFWGVPAGRCHSAVSNARLAYKVYPPGMNMTAAALE
jgi:hypothetical protein